MLLFFSAIEQFLNNLSNIDRRNVKQQDVCAREKTIIVQNDNVHVSYPSNFQNSTRRASEVLKIQHQTVRKVLLHLIM